MRALLLLGFVALALATSNRIPNPRWLEEIVPESKVQDTQFKSNREYQFVYNGQLLTGLPQSSKQHSATRIQAVCTMVFKSDTSCLLKCTHIRMGKLNDMVVEPRKMVPFSAFEEVQIDSELKELLQTVVKFTYTRGLISDIVFDGSERPWSANIKRGVLNMLQVNLQQHGRTDRTDDAVLKNEIVDTEDKGNDYFTAMEKTLEGECECDYTVTEQPCIECDQSDKKVLNVTKSVNFEKCRRRPDIKYNYRFSTPCPTCEKRYNSEEKVVRSSTVTKYHITGTTERFLINKVVCDSQYNYVPMTEQTNVITTYTKQKLELVKSGPIVSDINEPSNQVPSDSGMVFSQDWDVLKEKFFQNGEDDFQQKTPYSGIENKNEFVGQILRRLVRCLSDSVEECAPRQFVRLVKVLRMCKTDELREIHNSFYKTTPSSFTPEDHKKIKDLLVDALFIAGTKDSITHMVDKIKKREIGTIKASLSIKNLINVRVPSKHMIDQLLTLSEHEVCKRSSILRQSVLLTTGSLIHGLCGDHNDKLAQEFKTPEKLCTRSVKQEIVEKLFGMFRDSETTSEKILWLRTISNAGLDLSVLKLETIIKNTDKIHSTSTRMEAINGLRRLTGTMGRKIQKILMPIYMNDRELSDVRMYALYQIMETLPDRPVLDQITRKLFTERSRQVGSFTFTHLTTLANSTNPCEKRVADDLKLSLRRSSRSLRHLSGNSKLINLRSYSGKYDKGMDIDLALVMSSSYVPRFVTASLNSNSHSQWMKRLFAVGMSQTGAGQWLKKSYHRRSSDSDDSSDETLSRSPRSPGTMSPQNELKRIFQKLSISDRYNGDSTPLVLPYMKFKDQDISFMPITPNYSDDIIRELVDNDVIDTQNMKRTLERGIQIDIYQAYMLHEQSRKIPTSLGMPLRTSVKVPLITRLNGQVKGKLEPKIKLTVNLKPSLSLGGCVKMESWSPVVNSGLKVMSQLTMYTPINVEYNADTSMNPIESELSWKPHRNQFQLLKAESRPITYTIVWPKSIKNWQEPQQRTVFGEEWNRVKTIDSEFGDDSLGIKFRTHGSWHKNPSKRMSGTPFCPFSGPNKIQVTVSPGNQMPEEIVVKVTGKLFDQNKKSMKPKFNGFYDSEDKLYFDSDSRTDSSETRDYKGYETSDLFNNQLLVKIFTRGSSIKRSGELKSNCKCDDRNRHCKCDLDIKRTPVSNVESKEWKLKSEFEVFYPETPYRLSELSRDDTFLCQMKTKWGENGGNKKEVEMKIQGKRSNKQMRLLEKERSNYKSECSSPVCQYNKLKEYSLLCDYKIDIDYTLGTKEKNVTNKWYRYLKNYYFSQTDVNQINVQNPDNQVRCRITIDPTNKHLVNVTIKTPTEKSMIRDIYFPMRLQPVNIRTRSSRVRSLSEMVQRLVEPSMVKCEVRPRSIKTFDGVRVRLPFSKCYSVLAKDCSKSDTPRFAVMIKNVDQSSKKQMKILVKSSSIVLRSEQNDITVEINGDKKTCPTFQEITDGDRVVVRIQKQGPYCKVSLPIVGVQVYFDGYAADVKLSQLYHSTQCGLCGHFDGERSREFEFRNPQNKFVSLKDFHHSYLMQEQCDVEDYIQDSSRYSIYGDDDEDRYNPDWRSTKSGSCSRLSLQSVMGDCQEKCDSDSECSGDKKCCFNGCGHECVDSSSTGHSDSRGRRHPVQRTKVIEQGSELCFSKDSVPQCPEGTYPQYESELKVVYSCLSRSGIDGDRADRYHRQSKGHRNPIVQEVNNLPASFTQTEAIPKSCILY